MSLLRQERFAGFRPLPDLRSALPAVRLAIALTWALLVLATLAPTAAAQPGTEPAALGLSVHGQFRLQADQYHGAVPLSPPGVLPPGLEESQRREAAAASFGWGVQQVTRLQLRWQPRPGPALTVGLRHLGWWGVDQYTSGTYGAPAFLSDPLRVEEAYLTLPLRSGTVYAGRQYFQLGPVGLLAATPLGQLPLPAPIAGVIWEGSTPTGWSTAWVAANLFPAPSEEDSDAPPLRVQPLLAARLATTRARMELGLNTLLSGAAGEQGISLDWSGASPRWPAGELAWARIPQTHRWVGALVVKSPARPEAARVSWQMGAIDPDYPVVWAQLRDVGGVLPFAPGDIGLAVEGRLPLPSHFTAFVRGRYLASLRAQLPSFELELGDHWAIWPSLSVSTSYQHSWHAQQDYGRARLEVSYGF